MQPPKDPSLAAPSTVKWWSCPGVVYFLGVGRPTSAVKIGMLAVTENLSVQSAIARRVGQMQTSNHEPLEVLGIIQFSDRDFPTRDAEVKERELHIKFAHLARFKAGTKGAEWFNCSPELLDEVRAIALPPESIGIPHCYAALATPAEA